MGFKEELESMLVQAKSCAESLTVINATANLTIKALEAVPEPLKSLPFLHSGWFPQINISSIASSLRFVAKTAIKFLHTTLAPRLGKMLAILEAYDGGDRDASLIIGELLTQIAEVGAKKEENPQ